VNEHGLYFVAYGESLDRFERVLRRMAGLDDGIVDRLLSFTRAVSGGYYWCPPVDPRALSTSPRSPVSSVAARSRLLRSGAPSSVLGPAVGPRSCLRSSRVSRRRRFRTGIAGYGRFRTAIRGDLRLGVAIAQGVCGRVRCLSGRR
jgi:hypothetical protein